MGKLKERIIEKIAEKNHLTSELHYDLLLKKYEVGESTIELQKAAIALLQGYLKSAELNKELYKNAYYELLEGLDDDSWEPSECGLCKDRKSWIHDGEEINYCPRCGRRL